MITELTLDRKNATKSQYKPSDEAVKITKKVLEDFRHASLIKSKPYREFNDMTLMERQSIDQKRWNSYQEPKSSDPDESWKSNAIRPITRNKVISIAAHITGTVIYPNIYAQNENDEEDKDAAIVMRSLMEWANDQSDYERTFLYAVIAALVNPAVIIHTEYAEVKRKIKEITEKGTWTTKEVVDEIMSGFIDSIVPLEEIYLGDFYVHDIQKQPFIIRRRAIDYYEAKAKHGGHKNFDYVKPGIQTMFAEEDGSFYEQQDEDLDNRLVEEVYYYNRNEDLQLCFINGILVTEPDQPNPRKDKKTPFAMTGYELIDEGKFAFYKSLVFKMGPDQENIDSLYRIVTDGSILESVPATAIYGNETIDSSVMVPGKVTSFSDPQTKMEAIGQRNLAAGFNMLDRLEASVSESSSDPRSAGQADKGGQTAFEISRLEENARTMLGLFGKMIGNLVKDFGQLRVSDICQFLTVGEVMELSDGLKFRSFVLPERETEGGSKTRKIDFSVDLPEGEIDPAQVDQMSERVAREEMGYDPTTQKFGKEIDENKMEIYKVNPRVFRRMKYLVRVTPDVITPPSMNVQKALNLEEYDRAIQNPLADQEAVTRDLLFGSYDKTKSDPDKYMKKQDPMQMMALMGMRQQPGVAPQLASPGKPGGNNDLMQKVL